MAPASKVRRFVHLRYPRKGLAAQPHFQHQHEREILQIALAIASRCHGKQADRHTSRSHPIILIKMCDIHKLFHIHSPLPTIPHETRYDGKPVHKCRSETYSLSQTPHTRCPAAMDADHSAYRTAEVQFPHVSTRENRPSSYKRCDPGAYRVQNMKTNQLTWNLVGESCRSAQHDFQSRSPLYQRQRYTNDVATPPAYRRRRHGAAPPVACCLS